MEEQKQMRSMDVFMNGNAEEVQNIEVEKVISERFKDTEGNPVPCILKPTTTAKVNQLQKNCTDWKGKRGSKQKILNNEKFAAKLAVECTVYPNFKDKELLDSYGLIDPCEVIEKIFNLPGEYAELIDAVLDINGFDDKFEDLVEEAKN